MEKLISALYSPHTPPAAINSIHNALQQLQHSPQGWQIAQTLLNKSYRPDSPDDNNVKFFGAITLTVKLNTDGYVPQVIQ